VAEDVGQAPAGAENHPASPLATLTFIAIRFTIKATSLAACVLLISYLNCPIVHVRA
jgi:hypothetical protein